MISWLRALISGDKGLLGRAERAGLTAAGVMVLLVALSGWICARLLGGRAAFLVVYGSLLVLAFAWVVARRRVAVDAGRSTLFPRMRAGQLVEVELELVARRRISNVIVEELLPRRVGKAVRVPITALPAGRQVRHVYRFVPRHRGVYEIGPLVLTRSDPFGLTRRRSVLAPPVEVIVHPSTEPVQDRVVTREWEDPPIRPPVSKPWPIGFEFYGMREYSPGDDPRRIVWRAAARTLDPTTDMPKLMVRESEQGITDRVALLLDTNEATQSPGDPSDTFETGVRVVASLGARHLRDGFSVTFETNGARVFDSLRGERNRVRLLDGLARVQLERAALSAMVRRLITDRRRHNLHNVLVTSHLDAQAAANLRVLIDRGASLMIVLVLWPDIDPDTLRRASLLRCNLVEVTPGMPLEAAFGRLVGAGVRRERY